MQPGLAGLMDGSVSTLAPLFARRVRHAGQLECVSGSGSRPSIGAGISMGFAEALSDDGELTGRGSPVVRGIVTGAMTTIGAWAIRCPI